jgi:hypothetical protein
MGDKDLVNKGKEDRQKTMNKLSIENGEAYTYNADRDSRCLSDAKPAREKRQKKLDR